MHLRYSPLLLLPVLNSAAPLNTSMPVVDLGYGLWRASINEAGGYYNFSNIRYAQPPIGKLRFAPPKEPLINRTTINDGLDGRLCPQGFPSWNQERALFIKEYLSNPKNISAFQQVPAPGVATQAPGQNNGRVTEDCLFLDVLVPTGVYDTGSCANATGGAPVLVWMFGGGFYEGSKESQGNPAGIVSRSILHPSTAPGVIWVALNYRLGALGWLAGPSFAEQGGLQNAGFYDQRLAFEWIEKNIHLFGGDPKKVTIMGASAGASSGMHQITAYGGEKHAPFQQAFLLSPAFQPDPYNFQQEAVYQNFLHKANVSSLAELRDLSSDAIIKANEEAIFAASYSNSGFGPVVDGVFATALPQNLLSQGRHASNVKNVMSGHNTQEGLIFTNPAIQNTSAFSAFLKTLLPDAQTQYLNDTETKLYPPNFNLTVTGYNDTTTRLSTLLADQLLNCNVQALMSAFGPNKSHAYLFDEGPGLHGEEEPYIFYNGVPEEDQYGYGMVNASVALALQDWILNFAATGNPNGGDAPEIDVYGEGVLGLLSNKAIGGGVKDPAGKERCKVWNEVLYI